ncbi:MAG: cohesin domain-containing protein [Bacteroidales bacterium]
MKKILLFLISVLFSSMVFSQGATATIGNYLKPPGSVNIPVMVTNFNNVGAITVVFEYDPAVLTYVTYNTVNASLPGLEVNDYAAPSGSLRRIGIAWSGSGGAGPNVTGTMVNVVFTYISGTSNFTFLPAASEVANIYGVPIPVFYTSGSIGPLNPALVSIPQLLNQSAANGFLIPLNVDFHNVTLGVNSFTFIIAYDATKLVYQGIQNTALTGITVTQLANPARLVIDWSDPSGPGSTLNGELLKMRFNYLGGTSALAFDKPNCHIADHLVMEVPAQYTDGLVTQLPPFVVTVTAATLTATPGTEVLIPVTVHNFTNIGAFDFLINYNKSILTFTGLVEVNTLIIPAGNLSSNSTTTGVGINWQAGGTALTIPPDQVLFKMKFNYTSGATPLTFDQVNSEISDFTTLAPLSATYVNGAISEAIVATATAVIPQVVGVPLTSVEVPMNVTGFSNLGAFDLVVGYDPAALTFSSLINSQASLTSKGSLTYNATGGKLYISWVINPSEVTGINITDNAKLFDMNFSYNAGNSGLLFDKTLCAVTQFDEKTVNVAYTDGAVTGSIGLQVKVYLEGLYSAALGQMNKAKDFVAGAIVNRFPGTVADTMTIELHDAANYAKLIYKVTGVSLNQDGTASAIIPPDYHGSYYITIKHRNHVETTSKLPVSFANPNIIYNFTISTAQAFGDNQKLISAGIYGLYAGDVNQDGFVNATDRSLVNSRVISIDKGYLPEDINGDGSVSATDRSMVNSGVIDILHRVTP